MTSVTVEELEFQKQFSDLSEIAEQRRWNLERLSVNSFAISLPAKDKTVFSLLFECENYLTQPPAIHWWDKETGEKNLPRSTPIGSAYFHGSGVICAPWNRLAYKEVNPNGPHSDWQLSNWKSNPQTGQTLSISAMVLRILTELNSNNYRGRMG